MTRRTLRRQPRPAIRGRSETAINKHATDSNAPGRGHGCTQPFLWCTETAITHATSYLCGAMWCGDGRSTEREAASHHGAGSTHRVERIEPTNQIGSHGRVHLPNRIFTAHTNLPVFYYFTVLMFIGFGQKKQSQQIVRSGSLSSSLPTRSMAATSSACVTAVQNASYLRSQLRREI